MILTAQDAARRLGIAYSTIRKAAGQGRLPGAAKHGRDWMIPEESLRYYKATPGGRPEHRPKGEEK